MSYRLSPRPSARRRPIVLAVLAAIALPLHAQSPTPPAEPAAADAPAPASERAKNLDKIVVTGSRIPRAGFDTLEPASVVTREYIDGYGKTNVADALFVQPSFSAGASSRDGQAAFGAGVNFLSRFGLGSNRLLTLIDGRRFVSSNPPTVFGPAGAGQQVDLNVVPSILIDQVETIGIGGAPTYGSDAISGVTNILLRKNFDGVETQIGFGRTDRGDGDRYNFSTLFGTGFGDGRGHVQVALAYDQTDGILGMERQFFRDAYSLQPNPNQAQINAFQPGRNPATDGRVSTGIGFNNGNADGVPANVFIRDRRIATMTWGGLLYPINASGTATRNASGQPLGFGPRRDRQVQFDRQGNLVPYDPGVNFGNSSASGGDGVNLNETVQLLSDLERRNAYATVDYDFSDNVRGFFEGAWFESQARELVDQNVFNAINFGTGFVDGRGAADGSLNFDINNPFLSEQNRAVLRELGVTQFRLSRSSRDLSKNNAAASSRIWRAVAGLEGQFDIGSRRFDWEASLNHGRADFDYYGTGLVQQNFLNAINVVRTADGRIVCDSSKPGTVADPACRPLNLFGEGVASREALAYVATPTHATAQMRQTVFNANVSGGLFALPGGDFAFNVGYEHRREEGAFEPSEYQRLGRGRSVPISGNRGSFSTNELFVEALAPLVDPDAGLPGLHRLDLTAKFRRVDSSINGAFNAYTYGLQYEPIAGLQLRGNKTRSFRAPALTELFTNGQDAFFFIPEVCAPGSIDAGSRPAVRRRNCEAFFAANPNVNPQTFQAAPASQRGTINGFTGLQNEQADSWTAGIVFKPEWAKGLSVAADWYQIELTQAIASLTPTNIVEGCFDNDSFNANDIPNANEFCSLIRRDPATGVANGIATRFANGPLTTFRGWTGEATYRLDLDDLGWGRGRVDLSFYGFFPKELKNAPAPGIAPTESVGTTAMPERQFIWNARYRGDRWDIGATANYTSRALFSLTNTVETRDFLGVDSFTTYDLSVGYRFSPAFKLNLAVLNVGDTLVSFPQVYDALGRRYFLSATFRY